MGLPLGFLRGFLGAICIFFAHYLGRSVARAYAGEQRWARISTWLFRTVVAAAAVVWRAGFDTITIVVWTLSIVSAAAGFYDEIRPKRVEEDLTRQIFPDDDGEGEQG